jgi:hypothetical protein
MFETDSLPLSSFVVVSGKTGMRFESGYSVETVFDGSKAGIEPYSVSMSPDGELLVLDSENSNIYRISPPLSRCMFPSCQLKSLLDIMY